RTRACSRHAAARRPRHPLAARPAASEPPRRAEGHDPATGSRKSPRSPGCPVSSLQHQVVTPVTPARDAKGVVASPTPGAFMIAELIDGANNLIWSIPLIVGLLIVGLYFTIRTGLLQIRNLPDMLDQLKKGEVSPDGTSSFQSLMMSLSGRVGMGNIGGVATAIAFGGPGAVFWMWVSGFLGASTSFIERTLGQIYKEKDPDTGEYRGGPAFYFEKAYKHKAPRLSLFYGILFSVVTIQAMSFFLPGVQANGMASAIDNAWGIPTWVTALGLVILLGFIVIGGVKRIAHFAMVAVRSEE